MSDNIRVLSIDDDQMVQSVVKKSLLGNFHLSFANSGEEGLVKAEEEMPDVILLDVEMPRMNGYETCDCLKQNEKTRDIPVLFLSSLSDMRSRMLGFEVGASDFLIKPFERQELLTKLTNIGAMHQSQHKLREQVRNATETAFVAMRGSSELGVSMGFIERLSTVNNIEELATLFLSTLENLGLSCSLMCLTRDGSSFYSTGNKVISPLEQEVMSTIHGTGDRFTDFGCRTQVNFFHIALLVKNMPLDDMDRYGRLKDFLPTMLSATDTKLINLETENMVIKESKDLVHSFNIVQGTLNELSASLGSSQNEIVKLLENMLAELDEKIVMLGLDDDQEKYLIGRLDSTVSQAQEIIDKSNDTKVAFSTVTRLLDHLVKKQNKLVTQLKENQNMHVQYMSENSTKPEGSPGEVDLF